MLQRSKFFKKKNIDTINFNSFNYLDVVIMLHNKLPNEENVINNGANQEKFEGKTFSLNVLSLNLYFKNNH